MLADAHAGRDAELARHAAALARLDTQIAALTVVQGRSRRAALTDPTLTDEQALALIDAGGPLTLPELRAVLGRGNPKVFRAAVNAELTRALDARRGSSSTRAEERFEAVVDAVLEAAAWSGRDRVLLVSNVFSATDRLVERAATEPRMTLLATMHADGRTWGARPDGARRRFAHLVATRKPWALIGAALSYGDRDAAAEEAVVRRLLAVDDVDVLARLATGLHPRREKGTAAWLRHVEALFDVYQAVLAPVSC